MRYSWILCDADGTLFDYDRAESTALERAFAHNGHRFQPDDLAVYRRINHQIWLEFERGELTQDRLQIRRFEQLFDELGLAGDASDFSDRYLHHLGGVPDLLDGAEMLIRGLRGRVGLALITNGLAQVQRPRLAASSISDCFDPVLISEEIGLAKPDPRIFDVAFERMGSPARGEVLIVGDSLSSDIRGGNNYGIDTCWYNPAGKEPDPEVEVSYDVRVLSEIESLVEGGA